MTLLTVIAAVLLIGVPTSIFGVTMIWNQGVANLEERVSSLATIVDRRVTRGDAVTENLLDGWGSEGSPTYFEVTLPGGEVIGGGQEVTGGTVAVTERTVTGAVIHAEAGRGGLYANIAAFLALESAAAVIALVLAALIAARQSRRLSAPLIYLAASAEQIGAGRVRPHLRESGIEEIDLVSDELIRTADRMAGRLAAERQFAADASHQLRTPLTALSMRLDEIELISTDEEVLSEVRACQDQVERLTGVVQDLLKTSRSDSGGTTEAIHLARVFDQQDEEWTRVFRKERRELTFEASENLTVLATPGSLAQIIATLIENSLKYGGGATSVTARPTANSKGVVIEVADEGEGVDPEIADVVFNKHVSTGGSTGIGLALAKDLAQSDGARLELAQRAPAIFRLTLHAVPTSLDPDRVLPQGPLINMGSRRRRR